MTVAAALFFTHPLLLLGLLAIALPILAHLLLRPRPQRVRFPAIALLWPALLSGQQAGRVRNAALLAARIGVIALAVLLLAGPTCSPRDAAAARRGPSAIALVLDDSASMGYMTDAGRSLAEVAREEALRRITALAADGTGDAAVVHSSDDAPAALEATESARRRLKPQAGGLRHARTLGAALENAAHALAGATHAVRRLIIFTDMTARAWSDVSPMALSGIDGLVVEVVSVASREPHPNLSVSTAALPALRMPAGAPTSAAIEIQSSGAETECWLTIATEREALPRIGPLHLAIDSRQHVSFPVPPQSAGPHALRMRLEPADRLVFDQERFTAFETGPRPEVWLFVPDGGAPADSDLTSLLLHNLLAPAALDAAAQLVKLSIVTPRKAGLAETGLSHPTLMVAISGLPLPAAAVRSILAHVESGATLLLVPAGTTQAVDWPGLRPALAAAAPERRERAAATTLVWDRDSPYALPADASGNLAGVGIRRWLALSGLSQSAITHARYPDGAAAIVSKPIGRGRIVLLTTSPDPAWSDLGIEAAGLLTWLHSLIAEALGPPATVAEFAVGERADQRFLALPTLGSVRVVGPLGNDARSTWVTLDDGRPLGGWPTRDAGDYSIHVGSADAPVCRYVVNWPDAESDLVPISVEKLRETLGADVRLTRLDDDDAAHRNDATTVLGDPRIWLGALLLAALVAESWFACRIRVPSRGLA